MISKWFPPIAAVLTSTASASVDFVKEVQPILEQHCLRCHNEKATDVELGETDYLLDTAKNAIRDKYIIPGNGATSKLYTSTICPDYSKRLMPPLDDIIELRSRRLTKHETDILKKWIDEGAVWPESVSLVPRKTDSLSSDGPILIAALHQQISAGTKEKSETEMKPYSEPIHGSGVTFEMVPIPGGKFLMGSPENEPKRSPDEGPQREVSIESFWMGAAEVTWDEFNLFAYPREEWKNRGRYTRTKEESESFNLSDAVSHPTPTYIEMSFGMGTDGYPAICMTQHAANKYCQWLSARTGHFYRLPTEAEWEYAARAGTTTAYFWGDDASKISEYAWWGPNSDFKYQKVGKKKPNPWGLYDITGNVAEWTLDQYDSQFYRKGSAANPWNVATKPYPHAVRGGSWDDEDPSKLRTAARLQSTPEWKRQDPCLPKSRWYHTDAQTVGFRIVRPLNVPSADAMHRYWNSGVEKDELR